MVRPERRTKGDLLAAAAIAVTIALAAALIWWTSDARATISRPAAVPAPVPTAARDVPTLLNQLWDTASPATSRPVLVGGTVVTGAGREIDGRDPATGESLWSYARDSDLCAASWVYTYAVAVYRDDRGCGQVSAIEGVTGRRGPSRSGYADRHVDVSSDGMTVLSFGQTRLELWRSDLVRMLSYGEIDAPLKPSSHGLGTGCTLVSAAASSSAVSVLESCPQNQDLRLTLLRPGKEEDEPELRFVPEPGLAANSGARVLVVSDTSTAVYLPSPQPRVEVIDSAGATVASTLLPRRPAPAASTVLRAGNLFTWWTGDAVMVFDATSLTYRYTIDAVGPVTPLGPAASMTGKMLIPVTDGIGVYDPANGTNERYITVHRPPGRSVVVPAVYGSRIFEQRGDTVVALG